MIALERKNPGKISFEGKGMDSHGPQAALGMTESCHECRWVVIARGLPLRAAKPRGNPCLLEHSQF
jgi:hypothetical protein